MKRALITGIAGQDGSYLAEYLLSLGYTVFGLGRREPESLRWLVPILDRIEMISGDLRDATSLEIAFQKAWPDEIYNLAGQVFVPTSWEIPDETFHINVGGPSRILRLTTQPKPATPRAGAAAPPPAPRGREGGSPASTRRPAPRCSATWTGSATRTRRWRRRHRMASPRWRRTGCSRSTAPESCSRLGESSSTTSPRGAAPRWSPARSRGPPRDGPPAMAASFGRA